jgi:hypothetical protein
MDYSLCKVTFGFVYLPAYREAGVARILESLFKLNVPQRAAHETGSIIDDSPEMGVLGGIVYDAPWLITLFPEIIRGPHSSLNSTAANRRLPRSTWRDPHPASSAARSQRPPQSRPPRGIARTSRESGTTPR